MIVYEHFGVVLVKVGSKVKGLPVLTVKGILDLIYVTEICNCRIVDVGILIRLNVGSFTVCAAAALLM